MKTFQQFIGEAYSKSEKESQPERQAALEKEIDKEIKSTMGTAADRAAAAAARANPATQRSAALKRTIADRMAKGAEQNKLK